MAGASQWRHDVSSIPDVARSGQLDALIALEQIGTRLRLLRNQDIYGQGKAAATGIKSSAEPCASASYEPMDAGISPSSASAATGSASRAPRSAAFRPKRSRMSRRRGIRAPRPSGSPSRPGSARLLRDITLKSLEAAQARSMILARMTATERVASFLLELSERNDDEKHLELPMCRCDIGDYLGVTIETVCRVSSDLKRRGVIEVSPHSITLLDRLALEAIGRGVTPVSGPKAGGRCSAEARRRSATRYTIRRADCCAPAPGRAGFRRCAR